MSSLAPESFLSLSFSLRMQAREHCPLQIIEMLMEWHKTAMSFSIRTGKCSKGSVPRHEFFWMTRGKKRSRAERMYGPQIKTAHQKTPNACLFVSFCGVQQGK